MDATGRPFVGTIMSADTVNDKVSEAAVKTAYEFAKVHKATWSQLVIDAGIHGYLLGHFDALAAKNVSGVAVCSDCGDSGYVTVDVAQAGDQTLTEEHVCPACGGEE